jgi:hypothetical protein
MAPAPGAAPDPDGGPAEGAPQPDRGTETPVRFAVSFDVGPDGRPSDFKLIEGTGTREVDDALAGRLAFLQTAANLKPLADCTGHRIDFAFTPARVSFVISGTAPSAERASRIASEARGASGPGRAMITDRLGESAETRAWSEGSRYFVRVEFDTPSTPR